MNRITSWEGWAFAGGIRKTELDAPDAPPVARVADALVSRGLIRIEERQVPFYGSIAIAVPVAFPTDAGWATATHPPTDWQREFLRRRVHCCQWGLGVLPLLSYARLAGADGAEPSLPARTHVRSVRTKSGLAASKGLNECLTSGSTSTPCG